MCLVILNLSLFSRTFLKTYTKQQLDKQQKRGQIIIGDQACYEDSYRTGRDECYELSSLDVNMLQTANFPISSGHPVL
jgi:hypothetical protein